MGELLLLAPLVLLPVLASALKAWERNARERAARRAAEAAGLTALRPGDPRLGEAFLEGRSGDLSVSLEAYRLESGDSGMRLVVTGPGHAAGELSLLREDLETAREKRASGEREIETGDASFDAEFFVQAQPSLALAILGPETRRLVRNLMRHRLAIGGRRSVPVEASLRLGVLEVRLPDGFLSVSLEKAPDVLPRVLELGRRLIAPPDLAGRLAENLRAEPMAGVRRQCVTALAREFPGHPATRAALLASLQDPDAEVRVRAAIAAGPEGRDVLLAVAGGEGAPDETSARAVSGLASGLPVGEATDLLEAALRTRRVATARECLRVLGRRGPAAVPTVAKVLALEKSEPVAAAAAEALGVTGDASAESALLSALGSPHDAVRVAAARALGNVGTTAAVVPLRQLEDEGTELRRVARHAVARIQWRLTGAEPGQLSLTGGEAGQLSIAEGEAGRLALADESRDGGSLGTGPTGVPRDDEGDASRPGRRKPHEATE